MNDPCKRAPTEFVGLASRYAVFFVDGHIKKLWQYIGAGRRLVWVRISPTRFIFVRCEIDRSARELYSRPRPVTVEPAPACPP